MVEKEHFGYMRGEKLAKTICLSTFASENMFRPQSGNYEKTMTTIKNVNGILAGLLLLAAGCADNNPWNEGGDVGALRPEVLVDAAVGAAVTRAQMEELPEADVPSASDFTLEITKSDGSYSKSWLLADYDPESVALRSGKYIVTARYGDPSEEGSKRPYFVGSADVTVKAGETTPVNIEAALGNALVEITQTDNFLGYFSDFSLQLQSGETGAYVPVPRGQTDPTYVHPGQVDVVLTYTNWEGKSTTVRPVSMKVEAKKFYHVKLDLDTEFSNGVLHVTFDNGTEEEEVVIDLSAVENSPEPTVTASHEAAQSLLEGTRCAETPKFTLFAPAGIQSVALYLVSDPEQSISYTKGQDLCDLDADGQSSIEAMGIKTLGLFKNRDKMAEIDLSDFVAKLNPGTHELTVTLTDALSRQTSAKLSFQVVERKLRVESVGSVAYGAEEVEVTVCYNGNPSFLSFSVMNDTGVPVTAQVKSISKLTTNDEEFAENSYKAVLEVPSMKCERGIWVRIDGMAADGNPDAVVAPEYPQYSTEYDAFAKRAYVKVTAAELQTVMENMRFELYNNSSRVSDAKIDCDPSTGMITITGLNPGHDYTLAHSLDYRAQFDSMNQTSFTTEDAADVPNGDFEKTESYISNFNITQGGPYSNISHWQARTNSETYNVSLPIGWASVNDKTLNRAASEQNTWFVLPSTWNVGGANSGNVAVVVQSVGYDYHGSTPSRDTHTDGVDYNSKSPSNIAHNAAGKLFLGSYSINTSTMAESYDEGVDFVSRPLGLKGYYKFSPASNDPDEKGYVKVTLLSGTESIYSIEKNLEPANEYTKFEIPIEFVPFGKKPTQLRIMISSSNHLSYVASEEDSHIQTTPFTEHVQKKLGAMLTIDNLTFNYD